MNRDLHGNYVLNVDLILNVQIVKTIAVMVLLVSYTTVKIVDVKQPMLDGVVLN